MIFSVASAPRRDNRSGDFLMNWNFRYLKVKYGKAYPMAWRATAIKIT